MYHSCIPSKIKDNIKLIIESFLQNLHCYAIQSIVSWHFHPVLFPLFSSFQIILKRVMVFKMQRIGKEYYTPISTLPPGDQEDRQKTSFNQNLLSCFLEQNNLQTLPCSQYENRNKIAIPYPTLSFLEHIVCICLNICGRI